MLIDLLSSKLYTDGYTENIYNFVFDNHELFFFLFYCFLFKIWENNSNYLIIIELILLDLR